MKGMSCNNIQGALYAFPKIYMPAKAIEEAKIRGIPADELFCTELVN